MAWIKCSERFPEHSGKYRTRIHSGDEGYQFFYNNKIQRRVWIDLKTQWREDEEQTVPQPEKPNPLEKKYSEIDMVNALAMRDFAFADDETMQTAIRDYPKIWARIRNRAAEWFEKHKNKINA